MLDLKALEAKVDACLASETPESLITWLDNYRNQNNMAQYRKKPIVITAVKYDGNIRSLDVFPFSEIEHFIVNRDKTIRIPTLEGDMIASVGDYIIRGIKGEYYPCKPDIFEETYEIVE